MTDNEGAVGAGSQRASQRGIKTANQQDNKQASE